MTQRTRRGFQDGFIEIVEEQLKLCQEEVRDFDQEIERKQEEIVELRSERAAAAKRAQQLEDVLGRSNSEEGPLAAPVPSPKPNKPLADAGAVVELIREHGEAMHYLDIHRTLVARGVEIGGEGKADTLLSRYFNDPRLIRVSRGTYDLADRANDDTNPDAKPKPTFSRLAQFKLPSPPARRLNSRMTVAEMAAATLRQAGEPLHYGDITERILKSGAWQTRGKTPQDSVNSVMVVDIRDNGKNSVFVRKSRGVYGLREWEE